jgi:oxidase EvaA
MTILEWIEDYRKQVKHEIKKVDFAEMEEWKLKDGIIQRDDQSFFSIKAASTDHPETPDTVIVHQPEIGILGFILCIHNNALNILLHAKSEPGNINLTQIGPSVQATESNYNKKHSGRPTPFIDLFTDDGHHTIFSITQSEQGNRFFNKYNRNVAVLVDTLDLDNVDKKFKWFKLTEVVTYLNEPHLFNTDFKSVMAHLFEFLIPNETASIDGLTNRLLDSYRTQTTASTDSILTKIERRRKAHSFKSELVPLDALSGWDAATVKMNNDSGHFNFDYFSITMYDRERIHWKQPLITKESTEKLILIIGTHQGQLCMVFKERYEIGYANYFQLGPTQQFDEDSYEVPNDEGKLIYSFKQSEEGGRFYKNKSIYAVYERDDLEVFSTSEDYYILNVKQALQMLGTSGILTNESRTLLASFIPEALGSFKCSTFAGNRAVSS